MLRCYRSGADHQASMLCNLQGLMPLLGETETAPAGLHTYLQHSGHCAMLDKGLSDFRCHKVRGELHDLRPFVPQLAPQPGSLARSCRPLVRRSCLRSGLPIRQAQEVHAGKHQQAGRFSKPWPVAGSFGTCVLQNSNALWFAWQRAAAHTWCGPEPELQRIWTVSSQTFKLQDQVLRCESVWHILQATIMPSSLRANTKMASARLYTPGARWYPTHSRMPRAAPRPRTFQQRATTASCTAQSASIKNEAGEEAFSS